MAASNPPSFPAVTIQIWRAALGHPHERWLYNTRDGRMVRITVVLSSLEPDKVLIEVVTSNEYEQRYRRTTTVKLFCFVEGRPEESTVELVAVPQALPPTFELEWAYSIGNRAKGKWPSHADLTELVQDLVRATDVE